MQSSDKNKIAFVTPWFGEKIPGGAEAELRALIEHLKDYFEIEVLTTCVKDFLHDWNKNHWKQKSYKECGVTVRRFKVRKRDTVLFDEINGKLMRGEHVSPEEERIYIEESVRSPGLNEYIESHKDEYQWIIAIPYMFGTTYEGILAAGEKSALIPCLHDESYAYMDIYKEMVEKVGKVFFHVGAEKKLAEKIFGKDSKYVVVGEGVNTDLKYEKGAFKKKYGIENFVLYAGRKDSTKNTPELVEYFDRYQKETGSDVHLVLIGPAEIPLPDNDHIVDLGFVSVEDKYNAMGDAMCVCQPSLNESFSIVMMEGFLCETPALVNEKCEVTKEHVLNSNGGLYYNDYFTFYECIEYFKKQVADAKQMGKNGRRYVLENYAWPVVIDAYLKELT